MNGIDNPEITPCTYGLLIFYKEARIYNGKKSLLQVVLEKLDSHM